MVTVFTISGWMNKQLTIWITLAALIAAGAVSCVKQPDSSALDGWEKIGEDPNPEDPANPDDPEDPDDPDKPKPDDPSPDPPQDEHWFLTRGIVCGWDDVNAPKTLDYIDIARKHGLNTFSIYGGPRGQQIWADFENDCARYGIDLEYEEHMMSFLLPRNLFNTHPEYFRMNEQGVRIDDANGCPSNKDALEIVYQKAQEIGRNYKSTNHKYYFWQDDGGGRCYCPQCKDYNASDQALIYENVCIEALKEIDPDAMLCHLCYATTTEPPKKVKPKDGIFLEFAPFYRNWYYPLKDTWVEGVNGMTHAKYLKSLHDHLEVFPVETAQVLEYWLDDSMWSGWNRSKLKEVPWDINVFQSDLETYAKYGIRHITCYTAYVGPQYVMKFGYPDFLIEYAEGLRKNNTL